MDAKEPFRLNLGAGDVELVGYKSLDRKTGQEVYPLDYPDNSVDDIYASHILEHFSHNDVSAVVNDWVRTLKPGGRLRLAVPDFEWIARRYLVGEPINVQGYVMGGHIDADDHHGAIFDYETVAEILLNAGMERIGKFEPEYNDCTQLPVSLNVISYKPSAPLNKVEKTAAILSAPRYGPVLHFRNSVRAFAMLRIPYYMGQGAFWHLVLSEQIEEILAGDIEYVITVDYDSIFGAEEVLELYRLIKAFPQADAVCGMQMKRGRDHGLFNVVESVSLGKEKAWLADFQRHLTAIETGHLGLTIFNAQSLRTMPRPWMVGKPGKGGRWADGKLDPDIEFWHRWKAEGKTLYLANNVVVGHLSEAIRWPDRRLNVVWQEPKDYVENGIPPGAMRSLNERKEPE